MSTPHQLTSCTSNWEMVYLLGKCAGGGVVGDLGGWRLMKSQPNFNSEKIETHRGKESPCRIKQEGYGKIHTLPIAQI